jgi:hypothetical protein
LEGSPLQPVNRTITARHGDWREQWGDLKKTPNFTLPKQWRTGTVTLTAEVNEATHFETATFRSARRPKVIYVPIKYGDQTPVPRRIRYGEVWAYKVYPTDRINYIPSNNTIDWGCPWWWMERILGPCSREMKAKTLLSELTNVCNQMDDCVYIYGWLPEGTYDGGRASDIGGIAAFGEDDPTEGPRYFAHEIGHLMGRRHTNTNEDRCGPIDDRSDWPFQDSKIQDYGLDGGSVYWLFSSSKAIKAPGTTLDYMSNCGFLSSGNVWTSAWTYEHIYSETLSLQATALALQPLSTPQPYFIASGLVYTDDTAILDPIWVITKTVTPRNPPEGTQYCLEAQDASGAPLVSRCFDLTFVNYETGEATNVDGFNLMLPYPSGVARIVLKKGTEKIAVQLASANAPIVTVLSPNGGESWSATGTYTIT